MTIMSEEVKSIVSRSFVKDVDAILGRYYVGYYSEAKRQAEQLVEHYTNGSWESSIIKALHHWMTEWDGLKATQELRDRSATPAAASRDSTGRALFQELYTNLFIALLLCRETRNPAALTVAGAAARRAKQLSEPLNKAIAKLPLDERPFRERTGFFPRPWCALWFRAVSREFLGLRGEALIDFKKAYSDLIEAIRQEWRTAAGKSEEEPDEVQKDELLDRAGDPYPFRLTANNQPIVVRFFHDFGMSAFEAGHWGWDPVKGKPVSLGAETFLDQAARLAGPEDDIFHLHLPRNPYVRAGRALFYSFTRREAEALKEIHRAFCYVEERRDRWQEKGTKGDFYSSGRIYFQAGLLAYKYLRGQIRITEGKDAGKLSEKRITALEKAIQDLRHFDDDHTAALVACFDKDRPEEALSATKELFARACRYYLRIKSPFKALSGLMLMADPLQTVQDGNSVKEAARRLIWELGYGMGGDFTSNLIGYENLVAHHFASLESARQ